MNALYKLLMILYSLFIEDAGMKSRPELKDLLKELVSVIDWQLLMINMGVKKFENDKIERNHRGDIDRQKQEAFDKWLKMKPDACWKDVIDALYEVKDITLASSLSKKYDWKDPRVRPVNIATTLSFIAH